MNKVLRGRPQRLKEKKQQINTTIDKDVYEGLNLMRSYYFFNISDWVTSYLKEHLEALEGQLEKEDPEAYKEYLKLKLEENKA
jgi:hypothetical protein